MAGEYNAKTLNYEQPGAGAANYGVDQQNAAEKLRKLYADRNTVDGGSKTIFDAMVRNTDRSLARSPNSAISQQFKTYLDTGRLPDVITPQFAKYAVESLDYGLRTTGHRQQNKSIGLFEQIMGPLLTIAASAIPVIGPYAGAAVGGYVGSRNGGGVTGALLGAAGGAYSGASIAKAGGITNIANNFVDGVRDFATNPVGYVTGAARNLVNPGVAAAGEGAAGFSPTVPAAAGDLWNAGGSGMAAAGNWGPAATAAANGGKSLVDSIVESGGRALPYIAAAGAAGAAGGGSTQPVLAPDPSKTINDGTGAVNDAFSGTGSYYDTLRDDIYNFQAGELGKRYGDESRDLTFELARRGHLGGSAEVDATGELTSLYNQGRLKAGGIADSAVRDATQNDLTLKANAKRDILAGIDAGEATTNAINQSRLQSSQLADAAKGQNLGDIFSGSTYLYNQRAQARGAAQAADQFARARAGVGPATSGGGTVRGV